MSKTYASAWQAYKISESQIFYRQYVSFLPMDCLSVIRCRLVRAYCLSKTDAGHDTLTTRSRYALLYLFTQHPCVGVRSIRASRCYKHIIPSERHQPPNYQQPTINN